MVKNKEVIFASIPKGAVKTSDLQVKESEIELSVKEGSGDVIVKTMYISLDPYYRARMMEVKAGLYMEPFQLGKPLEGGAIAKVIVSDNSEFKAGSVVAGSLSFGEYVVIPGGKGLKKIDATMAPPSYYLGVCGMPGLTAYVGLKLIGKPKKGDQVFVTAAAGAVGQIVGQLAKVYGCRVVGSAGTDEKVELLKTELGYDDGFNYKKEKDLDAALTKHFPDGIDIYFDNVGGEMLEAVLSHMNTNGRIPMCGAISQYNKEFHEHYGVRNMFSVIGKALTLQGFLAMQWTAEHSGAYQKEVSVYLKEGKVKYKEDVTEGIEKLPAAFVGMMRGDNVGKAVVHVALSSVILTSKRSFLDHDPGKCRGYVFYPDVPAGIPPRKKVMITACSMYLAVINNIWIFILTSEVPKPE